MRRPVPLVILALSVLVGSGCAPFTLYKLVEPRERSIAGAYTVQPRLAWSSVAGGQVETWTIDGVALERLRFFSGIAEGQSLLGGDVGGRRPRFLPSLTRPEVAELVADSLFGSRFPARHVRPAAFGGAPGFRFELRYATNDGVKREAIVVGAVLQGRLHVIVYEGTALYHFDKYRDEVEQIIGSIRLTARLPRASS